LPGSSRCAAANNFIARLDFRARSASVPLRKSSRAFALCLAVGAGKEGAVIAVGAAVVTGELWPKASDVEENNPKESARKPAISFFSMEQNALKLWMGEGTGRRARTAFHPRVWDSK
jgi:hypothetical protein